MHWSWPSIDMHTNRGFISSHLAMSAIEFFNDVAERLRERSHTRGVKNETITGKALEAKLEAQHDKCPICKKVLSLTATGDSRAVVDRLNTTHEKAYAHNFQWLHDLCNRQKGPADNLAQARDLLKRAKAAKGDEVAEIKGILDRKGKRRVLGKSQDPSKAQGDVSKAVKAGDLLDEARRIIASK